MTEMMTSLQCFLEGSTFVKFIYIANINRFILHLSQEPMCTAPKGPDLCFAREMAMFASLFTAKATDSRTRVGTASACFGW